MRIEPFKPSDIFDIEIQESQVRQINEFFNMDMAESLATKDSFSAFDDNDNCIGCAGIINAGGGRGLAWAVLGKYSGRNFVSVVRSFKRMIDISEYRRLEMACDVSFEQAHRLALTLGFMSEGRMEQYFGPTKDAILYAKVNYG